MQAGANTADPADEIKCKRDIGLLIDYVGIDTLSKVVTSIRKFTLKYFDGGVFSYIVSEAAATVDAYNAARDLMVQSNEESVDDH